MLWTSRLKSRAPLPFYLPCAALPTYLVAMMPWFDHMRVREKGVALGCLHPQLEGKAKLKLVSTVRSILILDV